MKLLCFYTYVPSFKFRKMSVPEILGKMWGQNWVKMGFFEVFSESLASISFILLDNEAIIILHMCATFQLPVNFCSRDIG